MDGLAKNALKRYFGFFGHKLVHITDGVGFKIMSFPGNTRHTITCLIGFNHPNTEQRIRFISTAKLCPAANQIFEERPSNRVSQP